MKEDLQGVWIWPILLLGLFFVYLGSIFKGNLMLITVLITLPLFSVLSEYPTPKRNVKSIIPIIPALIWIYAATHIIHIHRLPNGIKGAILSFIAIFGIPIAFLAHKAFWSITNLHRREINGLTVAVLLMGGSIYFGYLALSFIQATHIDWEAILGVSIIPGVFEEIMFRGIIQDRFAKATGSNTNSVALTSLLFGVGHWWSYGGCRTSNPLFFFLTALIFPILGGVLFGTMKSLGKSTIPPILAHCAYNAVVRIGDFRTFIGLALALPFLALGTIVYFLTEN